MGLLSTDPFLLLGSEESELFITEVLDKLNISLWSFSISKNFPLYCSTLALRSLEKVFALLTYFPKRDRLRYLKYCDRVFEFF